MIDTVKFNKGNVKMIAHRGASALESENSCAAFIAAANRTYYGIETDVHVTLDGKFVVIHDDSTSRTTGKDMIVEQTRYEDLKKLNLFDKGEKYSRSDLVIPDLVDYIRICKRYGKKAVLELKNQMKEEHILGIVNEIKREDYLDEVIFISFALENLLILRKHLPTQPMQYLVKSIDKTVIEVLLKNNFGVDVLYKHLSAEQAKLLKSKGISINVWTCDDADIGEKMAEFGVDYITTNILE